MILVNGEELVEDRLARLALPDVQIEMWNGMMHFRIEGRTLDSVKGPELVMHELGCSWREALAYCRSLPLRIQKGNGELFE